MEPQNRTMAIHVNKSDFFNLYLLKFLGEHFFGKNECKNSVALKWRWGLALKLWILSKILKNWIFSEDACFFKKSPYGVLRMLIFLAAQNFFRTFLNRIFPESEFALKKENIKIGRIFAKNVQNSFFNHVNGSQVFLNNIYINKWVLIGFRECRFQKTVF